MYYLAVEVSFSSYKVLVDLLNPLVLKSSSNSLYFSDSLCTYGVIIEAGFIIFSLQVN